MSVKIHNRWFEPFLDAERVQERVKELATKITADYDNKMPVFVAILNGSFMFAGDLLKHIHTPCEITFVKLASYEGVSSSGMVKELIGAGMNLVERHVVVLEDIVDTGNTMHHIVPQLYARGASSVVICSLLLKPEALEYTDLPVQYVGFEIPNKFVVGYGLDFDGLGRNYAGIYQVV
jgi:hypoxanthine phosphoribosyltransferase